MESLKIRPADIDHVLWLIRIFQKISKARGALAAELESKMIDAYANPLGFTVIECFATSRTLQVRCSKVVQEAEVSAKSLVGATKDDHPDPHPSLGNHEESDGGAVFGDPAEDLLEEHHEPLWKGPVSTDVTFSLTEIVIVLQKVVRKHGGSFREIGRSVIRELVELSWLKQNHKPGPKSGDDGGS